MFRGNYDSPLGEITVLADNEGVCAVYFPNQRYAPDGMLAESGTSSAVIDAVRWLEEYFSGNVPDFLPPLHLAGTQYGKKVWEYLLTIPYGKTVSYGDIAAAVGGSPRSVGGAVGRNPVAIIVPCHRVVGAGGEITGYAGGIERKKFLLSLEGGTR